MELKLNGRGIRSLLNSKEIRQALKDEAKKVSERAGGEYKTDVRRGQKRAHARVATKNRKGVERELDGNYLLKALD